MACLQNTRKILLSDQETSLTIIWKLPIAPVVRIVSKYFETTGAIGTIRMIVWKPGLSYHGNVPHVQSRKFKL